MFSINIIHSMRVRIWYTEANFPSIHNISFDIKLEMNIAKALKIKSLKNLFESIFRAIRVNLFVRSSLTLLSFLKT